MDFGRPLGLFCLFVFVVHSQHHYIEWTLCAVGALVMFSGISVLTSIISSCLLDPLLHKGRERGRGNQG